MIKVKKIRLKTDQNHPAIKEYVAAVKKGTSAKNAQDQTSQDWEKTEDNLVKLMENKVQSVVGEDGLTVWDFADLRDGILNLLAKERETARREERERLLDGLREGLTIFGSNDRDAYIDYVEFRSVLKALTNPSEAHTSTNFTKKYAKYIRPVDPSKETK